MKNVEYYKRKLKLINFRNRIVKMRIAKKGFEKEIDMLYFKFKRFDYKTSFDLINTYQKYFNLSNEELFNSDILL